MAANDAQKAGAPGAPSGKKKEEEQREQLVRPGIFILMIGAVVAVLVFLFPRGRGLEDGPDKSAMADSATIAYLEARLRARPDDDGARLTLVDLLRRVGRYAEARRLIAPLFGRDPGTPGLRLLALELAIQERNALPEDDPRRKELLAEARRLLEMAAGTAAGAEREKIAKLALELGRPEVAARMFLQMADAERDVVRRATMLRAAGRWLLAAGQGARAASVLQRASELAPSGEETLALALEMIDALVGAGRGGEALERVERLLARFPHDRALLGKAIAIARSQSDHARARKWAAARLALDPNDTRLIQQTMEVYLGAGDVAAALELATRLVERAPGDVAARRRRAQLAEWSGRPDIALQDWLWLGRKSRDRALLARALALAQGTHDDERTVELLLMQYAVTPPTRVQVVALVVLLENLGRPKQAEGVLRLFLQREPADAEAWEVLAYLMERQGDLEGCLAVWREMTRRFGGSAKLATKEGEMLWRLHRAREALDAMLRQRERVAATTTDATEAAEYWGQLAELAWELEDTQVALLAYRRLWDSGKADADGAERLLVLLRDSGDIDGLIAVATRAWERFKTPRHLLLAVNATLLARRWKDARRLLRIAGSSEGSFARLEDYWLMKAQLATVDERPTEAHESYEKALALQPGLRAAQVGFLWTLVETGERTRLKQTLRRWRTEAETEPAFWGAYAIAHDRLGHVEESLRWYEMEARAHPNNHELTLAWASALDRAQRKNAAYRLRRFLLGKLRPKALAAARHLDDAEARSLVRGYANLVAVTEGPAEARAWLERLRTGAGNDRQVQEMLVSWYLDREQPDAARFWLRRLDVPGHPAPATQRLGVALAGGDMRGAAAVLDESGASQESLSRAERLDAALRLGRDDTAWALATGDIHAYVADDEMLQLQRDGDDVRHGRNDVQADFRLDTLGGLLIDQHRLRLTFALPRNYAIAAIAAFSDLRAPSDDRVIGKAAQDLELGARGLLRFTRGEAELGLGLLLRRDSILPYVNPTLSYAIARRARLRASFALNEVTDESDALRLGASRTQLGASFAADLTPREYVVLGFALRQYRTRGWELLGQGLAVDAQLGHRVFLSRPEARIALTGSLLANDVAPLPPGFTDYLPSDSREGVMVLPTLLGLAGVSIQLGQGDPLADTHRDLRLRYLADLWFGWAGPPHRFAFHVRVGVALPVGPTGLISVGGYYGNDLAAGFGQTSAGMQVMYTHRFGR